MNFKKNSIKLKITGRNFYYAIISRYKSTRSYFIYLFSTKLFKQNHYDLIQNQIITVCWATIFNFSPVWINTVQVNKLLWKIRKVFRKGRLNFKISRVLLQYNISPYIMYYDLYYYDIRIIQTYGWFYLFALVEILIKNIICDIMHSHKNMLFYNIF